MMQRQRHLKIMLLTSVMLAHFAYANTSHNQSTITSFDHTAGLLHLNVNSGDSNLQDNAFVFSSGKNGLSQSNTFSRQTTAVNQTKDLLGSSSALIGKNAFNKNSGMTSINQVSGLFNQQSNQVAIALNLSGQAIAENLLEQSYSNLYTPTKKLPTNGDQSFVGISDGAFSGTTGLVQLNQTAGIGNQTANGFALSIAPGAK